MKTLTLHFKASRAVVAIVGLSLFPAPLLAADISERPIDKYLGDLIGKLGPVLVDYFTAECAKFGWGRLAAYFAIVALLNSMVPWGISRLIAKKEGTLKNAAFYQLYRWLAFTVFAAGVYGCVVTQLWAGIALLGLVFMVAGFFIPMKVYKLGFFRTLGFLLCFGIASVIAAPVEAFIAEKTVSGGQPLPWNALAALPPAQRQAILDGWAAKIQDPSDTGTQAGTTPPVTTPPPAPNPAAPTPGPVNVVAMHDRLQAERAKLDTSDAAAVALFNQHVAEYSAANARLAATLAAVPTHDPTPVPKKAVTVASTKKK